MELVLGSPPEKLVFRRQNNVSTEAAEDTLSEGCACMERRFMQLSRWRTLPVVGDFADCGPLVVVKREAS